MFSSSESDDEPVAGDLKRLEDEQTRKLQEEVEQAAAAMQRNEGVENNDGDDEEDCNAEESTPDEDEDDLDEVERRIAEQERMINDAIDAKSGRAGS